MAEPNLAVVVLAWNQPQLTERCIDSIRANTDTGYELIVVDNGSTPPLGGVVDDTGDALVRLDENLGFATGMNRGLAAANAPRVAFVNNDAAAPPAWASRLVETLDAHQTMGIVLPAVTAAGNPTSVRTEPGTRKLRLPPFRDLPSAVVYVMRTAVMRELGGWDERYRLGGREDLDLLFTVWCNGLDVVLDERVLFDHVGHATAGMMPDRDQIWRENRERFVAKWTNPMAASVPRLSGSTPVEFTARLEMAATAAHWLQQRFAVEDDRDEIRRITRERVAELQARVRELRDENAALSKRLASAESDPVRRVVSRIRRRLRRT